jgi:flagellar basal-body rod protein FlgF
VDGLLKLGALVLSGSERRLEGVSRNVANLSTPGYKREVGFAEAILLQSAGSTRTSQIDLAAAAFRQTDSPLDLAIEGEGFFMLSDGAQVFLSRGGQFSLDVDGTVINALGQRLLSDAGVPIMLSSGDPAVLADGLILENGQPVARVGLVNADIGSYGYLSGGSSFLVEPSEIQQVEGSRVRQGMLEGSNVSTTEEMVTMMMALRAAESGSRLVQTYDTLMGQAITVLGRAGR